MNRRVKAAVLLAWFVSVGAVARTESMSISVRCVQGQGAVLSFHNPGRTLAVGMIHVYDARDRKVVWSVHGLNPATVPNGTIVIGTELSSDSVDVPFAGFVEGQVYHVSAYKPGRAGFVRFVAEEACVSERPKSATP